MKKLLQRNYDAVVKRGLITSKTDDIEFKEKIFEELNEIDMCFHYDEIECKDWDAELYHEIGDVIIVCTNWLIHRGIDIEKLLTEIAEKNERRAK